VTSFGTVAVRSHPGLPKQSREGDRRWQCGRASGRWPEQNGLAAESGSGTKLRRMLRGSGQMGMGEHVDNAPYDLWLGLGRGQGAVLCLKYMRGATWAGLLGEGEMGGAADRFGPNFVTSGDGFTRGCEIKHVPEPNFV
jgi:hypothetical protein